MVKIEAEGVLVAAKPFSEYDVLASVLTDENGIVRGLVKGGLSRRKRADMQPGSEVHMLWSARLESHLGIMDLSPEINWPGQIMQSASRLAALNTTCELLASVLSERDSAPEIYRGMQAWLQTLSTPYWGEALVAFELALLGALGFALRLDRCAVTGKDTGLLYVSPKSGRAVSQDVAEPYAERLLPLPAFLCGQSQGSTADIVVGLKLTGHFLARYLFSPYERDLPPSRDILMQRLERTIH